MYNQITELQFSYFYCLDLIVECCLQNLRHKNLSRYYVGLLLFFSDIWLICIFKVAFKMVRYELHIFLSTVHTFYCMGLKSSFVSLLQIFLKISKFGSFAYSIYGCQNSKFMLPIAHHFVYILQFPYENLLQQTIVLLFYYSVTIVYYSNTIVKP